MGSPLAESGPNPEAFKLRRPSPLPRVLAESRTPRKEAEDTRPRTVRTPRRQAGSRGVSEARLVPLFPSSADLSNARELRAAALPWLGPQPLEERGSWEGARGAGFRGVWSGASRGPVEPPAGPGVPGKVPALGAGPPRLQVGGDEGRVREPRAAPPPGRPLRTPRPHAWGRWERGPRRARAPPEGVPRALRGRAPGRRGRESRRVLPNPGTKVLRKRQMTATGKGM